MRASIIALGFAAALAPAIALAQAPADPNAATAPPPTYASPPAQTTSAPPPQQTYAPPPPMAVAEPQAAAPKGLSVWGILPWGGYGAGARFMMPVGIQPLLRSSSVRDNFALEFGADFLHRNYGILSNNYGWTEILPVVGLMWNIWLNPQFALYPKVELGYAFGWYTGWQDTWGPRPTYGGFFWDVGGGLLYKLNGGLTLRAEAGYAGLKLGVGWLF
jgi:hypothetical protein